MRWVAVWRRNFLVWRKLFIASVLTNLADPLIMLFGLGYGLGALLPSIEGMSYIAFFAAGTLCSATMFTRLVRIDVLGLLAHARAEDLGRASSTRRSPSTTSSRARSSGRRARPGFRAPPSSRSPRCSASPPRRSSLLALPVAFLVGLAFAAVGLIMTRAREELGLLQLLHDARHDADDHDLRRVLPRRAASRARCSRWRRRCRSITASQLVRPLVAGRLPDDIRAARRACSSPMLPLGYAIALHFARRRLHRADALGQVAAHHLHGDLVRRPLLSAAPLRLSRDGRGPAPRASASR